MMNSTKDGQHGASDIKYNSSLHCLQQTLRIEGIRGLFKGFVPCYVRMAPQVVIIWVCVEQYRRLWDRVFVVKKLPLEQPIDEDR
jgi:solute carrier family 25 uncoupling protein 27